MARLLLLTRAASPAAALPALDLLGHDVEVAAPHAAAVAARTDLEAVLLDVVPPLAEARDLARDLASFAPQVPRAAVVDEGALAALTPEWGLADVVLRTAGPAEVEARIRLLGRAEGPAGAVGEPAEISAGGLVIDADGYRARLDGRALNLTYREFELLKHLALHPGRVFSREQLLQDVWGYDYFGGTRTVDVHVRRLRAKLGADREQMIATVRNVGYRFAPREGGD